jgi:hypothetical protein
MAPENLMQGSLTHRLSGAMRRTKWLAALALLVASHSPAYAQTCLDEADKPGTSSREVTLRTSPSTPSFYYRADDYVAFIPQDDVMAFFEAARSSERTKRGPKDQSMARLSSMILSDLPIKANQDLFAYVTRDWSLWNPVNFSIIQLISSGNATLTDLQGTRVSRLTILREQSQQVRSTVVLLGAKPLARILWKYECSTG